MKKLILFLSIVNLTIVVNAQWQQTSLDSGRVNCFATKLDTVFAGTMNGMYLTTNSGTSWVAVNTGLTPDTILALAISGNNIFAGTLGKGVYLSSNNGQLWNAINTGLPANLTIEALVVKSDTIFAGTYENGVYLSINNGTSWDSANTGLPINSFVRSLAIKGDTLFAGIYGVGVYMSLNNGANWSAVNAGLTSNIMSFEICGNNIYAGGGNGVYSSSINEHLWTEISIGLPTNPNVNALTNSGSYIFAGTHGGGVYLCLKNGNYWTAWNTGFTNTYIMSLVTNGSNIFAGTAGSGAWKRSLTEVGIEDIINNERYISVYPVPAKNNLTIECLQKTTIEIFSIQGQIILEQQLLESKTTIDISGLANGIYILKLKNNDKTEITKIVKE